MIPPSVPDSPQFTCRLRTRWSDEDLQNVLNNAVYLTLMEEARHAFFGRAGRLDDGGRFPFVLAQVDARFLRPGRGGVDVTVELTTVDVGRSSFRQAYRVRGPEGDVWCEAEAALVCVDGETGRPRPMDDAFRASLARTDAGER